ncbi:MAG: N-acyl-L-amino acid amidohydrolase [Flavobacteriaceae bacterium]|nr:N-acyl-L-amino acid amidohydrolase [Flavobacteriaceae bacterium]|tara:strand:+ start:13294 stop:14616 length:1323 start_codon:yes stop_codon:yes gene_type:complete
MKFNPKTNPVTKKYFLALPFILSLLLNGQNFDAIITELAVQHEAEIIELRHWFHQNAELSNREFKTAEKISAALTKIGLVPKTGVAKTGVVAVLNGGKPGPVVALRADIDGLPVKERADLPWKSNMVGEYNGEKVPVMHACGHDTHTAMLLGVAKILYAIKDDIPGSIKFIFQPAEEGAPAGEEGGAELMVKEGVLKNPDVAAIFGLHIWSQFPAGNVYLRPKGIMAAVNEFRIDLQGVQTHGSTPWTGIDPIVTAAQIVNNIQTIVSRSLPLTEAGAVVTIGSIHGGVRSNIIPESLYMLGTIRTLDEDMKAAVLRRLEEIVYNTAKANNAKAEITYQVSYPITYNDTGLYENMLPSLKRINGPENVHFMNAITGAEDFSFFQKEVPGLYFFIGGAQKGTDPTKAAPHHTPDFYVDDSAMLTGVKSMTTLALDYLSKKK